MIDVRDDAEISLKRRVHVPVLPGRNGKVKAPACIFFKYGCKQPIQ
jgi:hypothetical protein